MKKTLSLVIIALLFAGGPLMSQRQLYIGVGGTGLSSWITNVNNYGLNFNMDYKQINLGGAGNINLGFDFSKHAGLKLEIGYAKVGQELSKDTKVTPDTVYARKIKLNYLQIPLMFKYRTSGLIAKFYIMVGPQFNFLLSATQTYTRNDLPFGTLKTNLANQSFVVGDGTITGRYASLDIMGRLDLGIDITIAKYLLLDVGLTMGYGLTDINGTDWRMKNKDGNYNASHIVTAGINVGLNYRLPL